MSRIVECGECNAILNKQDIHADFSECPNCGSTNILYKLSLSDKVEFHENIQGKVKEKGIKKPRREFFYGDDLYKTQNKWVDKKRVIDRENDMYVEEVIEKETDEVIHKCEESLKDHFGHGSAKFKKE